MSKINISACVMTYNEEAKIRACLESITWCDEIVIVDSFSTDHTVAICREFTDKIYQEPWRGYIGQRNYMKERATHEWVLFLDADEAISPGLRNEIMKEYSRGFRAYAGYEFPRQVFYLQQWIRHGEWYPDIKLRLFKKSKGQISGIEPHDQVFVKGQIKRFKYPIYHFTYDNIEDHLDRLNRYSSITASEKWNRGDRFIWVDFLFRPPWRFFRGFVLQGGFLSGRRGLLISIINAFGVAMKYAKLWELELREGRKKTAKADEDSIR